MKIDYLIEADQIAYSTPKKRVLASDLSFRLCSGQILVATGANGSGKTTLLKVILQNHPLDRGTLSVSTPKKEIGYFPQLSGIGIHFPLTLHDVLDLLSEKKWTNEEVEELGLLEDHHLELAWNTASGGERARAVLTAILSKKPQLLLLDEPFNHLDPRSRELITRGLARYVSAPNTSRGIVAVSHQAFSSLGEVEKVEIKL